jgi:hypothetical protein
MLFWLSLHSPRRVVKSNVTGTTGTAVVTVSGILLPFLPFSLPFSLPLFLEDIVMLCGCYVLYVVTEMTMTPINVSTVYRLSTQLKNEMRTVCMYVCMYVPATEIGVNGNKSNNNRKADLSAGDIL